MHVPFILNYNGDLSCIKQARFDHTNARKQNPQVEFQTFGNNDSIPNVSSTQNMATL